MARKGIWMKSSKSRVEMVLWHDVPYLIRGKVKKISKTKKANKNAVFELMLTVEVEDVSVYEGDSLGEELKQAGVSFVRLEGRAIDF